MHRPGGRVEDPGLRRTRQHRLLRRQLQQSQQPSVLCLQPSDLGAQRRQLATQRTSYRGQVHRPAQSLSTQLHTSAS